jgi:hypothetical protein
MLRENLMVKMELLEAASGSGWQPIGVLAYSKLDIGGAGMNRFPITVARRRRFRINFLCIGRRESR